MSRENWIQLPAAAVPNPTYWPALMAAAIALVLLGLITNFAISGFGVALAVFAGTRLLRDQDTLKPENIPHESTELAVPAAPPRGLSIEPAAALNKVDTIWLHRLAWVAASLSFLAIVFGSIITSLRLGAAALRSTSAAGIPWQTIHTSIALLTGAMLALSLLKMRSAGSVSPIRQITLAAAGCYLLVAASGTAASQSSAIAALHAVLAQILFAAIVVLAVVTSPGWASAQPMEDAASLRSLSLWAAGLVFTQVSLGAATRHQLMSPLSHIGMALIVALMLLITSMLVVQKHPDHRQLRPTARWVIGLTFAQVLLGMAVFILRQMAPESSLPVLVPAVGHVGNGALTLAGSVVLAVLIRRHLRAASVG